MPIYEYRCTACNDQHEIIQKISDPPLAHCPKCGGEMKKLFSSPAIQFKGSGFYKTDYASSSSGARGGSKESSGGSKSESGGDSATAASDSTSAAKGDAKGGGNTAGD